MKSPKVKASSWLEPALVVFMLLLVSLLYWFTLYSGIGGRINYGDSVKWQFLWAVGGTPHSTGYPLFLAITKIFGELFVFLEPYRRISLVSLVFGTASLIPVYLITAQFTRRLFLRIAAPALLAFSTTYWSQSTEPEVYTLSVFLSAASLYLLLIYVDRASIKALVASLIVYAISFGNHLTVSMLMPVFVYAVLSSPKAKESVKTILCIFPLLALLSFGQYAYIYYLSHKGGPYLEVIGSNVGLPKLIDYSTGGQFRGTLGSSYASPVLLAKQVAKLLYYFHRDLRLPLCLTVGYAFIHFSGHILKSISANLRNFSASAERFSALDTRENKRMVIFIAAAAQLLYVLSYPIGDIETYYISVYAWMIPLSISLADDFLTHTESLLKNANSFIAWAIIATLVVQFMYGYRFNKSRENSIQLLTASIFDMVPSYSYVYVAPKDNYALYEALWYYSVIDRASKKIQIATKSPEYYLIDQRKDAYFLQRISNGTLVDEKLIEANKTNEP